MRTVGRKLVRGAAATAFAVMAASATGSSSRAGDAASSDTTKVAFSAELPNVPGKRITAVVVSYAPGGKSPAHHHSGSVIAYVLTGAIRSENSATGPVRIYKAGQTFFEPPGSEHLISENASETEPASLLAIFVAEDGARLTTFDK